MNKNRPMQCLYNMCIILYLYKKWYQFRDRERDGETDSWPVKEKGIGGWEWTRNKAVRVSYSVLCPGGLADSISVWWQDFVCYPLQVIEPRSAPSAKSKCTRTTMTSDSDVTLSALLIMWLMSLSSTPATAPSCISKVSIKTHWLCSVMMTFYVEVSEALSLCQCLWWTQTHWGGRRYHFTPRYVNLYLTKKSFKTF